MSHSCTPFAAAHPAPPFVRKDVDFDADRITLRGWLYQPVEPAPHEQRHPLIVMSGGYGTTKEMFTDLFAERFAGAGFMVLLYDHRGFGSSDGAPRREINPWQQIEDMRHAVTFASGLSEADAQRIGVWGSSYSGGHAIVLAATDRRVRCAVAQVPTVSGTQSALRRVNGEAEAQLLARLADDRQRRARGSAPRMLPIMGDAGSEAVYKTQEAVDWYTAAYRRAPQQVPEVSLRSVEWSRAYNPGDYIQRVSPTPLLMVVAERDTVTPTDLALLAYNQALEPKALTLLPGSGHFDPYIKDFEIASTQALDWYRKHLGHR